LGSGGTVGFLERKKGVFGVIGTKNTTKFRGFKRLSDKYWKLNNF